MKFMFYKIHGVRVLIYNHGKLLILKRTNSDKDDANLWDVPGGEIESGENIYDAIKREVLEEIGVEPPSITIKDLHGLIFGDFGVASKLIIAVFICQSATANIQLNSEHSEYRWIRPKELVSYKLGRILQVLQSSLM